MLPCYHVWKPTEVSEVVQLLMNATFMHTKVRRFAAQRQECGEDSRRWASTPDETNVKEEQPCQNCCLLLHLRRNRRRTSRALKNDLPWATYHISVLSKPTGSDSVSLRREPDVHGWIGCVGLNMVQPVLDLPNINWIGIFAIIALFLHK